MSYKPERPVTSDKIRKEIEVIFNKKYAGKFQTRAGSWKREFKRRLPTSRGWVRGYRGSAWSFGPGPSQQFWALAIASEDDTKIESIYLCQDADEECKRLGVNEIMFS